MKTYHQFIALLLTGILSLFFSHLAKADSNFTGALAPDFKLQNQNSDWISLKDFNKKWLVLYFYPKDDTPGCTTEAKNFRDSYQQFKDINSEIVGISVDDVESHKSFAEIYELPFNILSDTEHTVSKAYEVLGGIALIKYAKRQTFIIDPDGNIVYHYQEVKPEEHAKNVLAKVKALQEELAD